MADDNKSSPQNVATEISFCPHLGLYHYKRADGEEHYFDNLKLEMVLDEYIKSANERQAEFMALLTGLARQYPHQVVQIDGEGKVALSKLEPAKHPSEVASDSDG